MITMEVMSGSESFRGYGSVTVNVLVGLPALSGWKFIPLLAAMQNPKSGVEKISMDMMHASTINSNHGNWFSNRIRVERNRVLKIVANKRGNARMDFGTSEILYLKADSKAPFYHITLPTTGAPSAVLDELVFSGRFRILDFETVTDDPEKYPFIPAEEHEQLFMVWDGENEGFFDVQEREPELATQDREATIGTATAVKSGDGKRAVRIIKTKKRSIKL